MDVGGTLVPPKPSSPTVCFILGLAASGKSHLGDEMKKVGWSHHFDENFEPGQKAELIRRLQEGQSCSVSESTYSTRPNRKVMLAWLLAAVPEVKVMWICFENDLATANWNCHRRTDKGDPVGHQEINNGLHNCYTYPEEAEVRSIYRLP